MWDPSRPGIEPMSPWEVAGRFLLHYNTREVWRHFLYQLPNLKGGNLFEAINLLDLTYIQPNASCEKPIYSLSAPAWWYQPSERTGGCFFPLLIRCSEFLLSLVDLRPVKLRVTWEGIDISPVLSSLSFPWYFDLKRKCPDLTHLISFSSRI